MKKSFMTRVLATGLSLAMAFSLSAATNVSVASAAAKPAMKSSKMTVKVGQKKNYQATAATQKAYKITKVKMSAAGKTKAKVTVNSSKKSIKVEGLAATKGSNVVISFKNNKTKKTTKVTTKVVVKAVDEKYSIVSATATGVKKVEIKLNKAVAADKTVKVTVKKVNADRPAEATVAGDTITLAMAAKLTAGDYAVTVAGLEDTDLTANFNVEKDETLTSFEIAENLVADRVGVTTCATFKYAALNQYGEKMLANVPNATCSFGDTTIHTAATATAYGTFDVKNIPSVLAIVGVTGSVTVVDQSGTGVTSTKTVTFSEPASASTLEFVGVYNKNTASLVDNIKENDKLGNYELLYTIKDQYGFDCNEAALNSVVRVDIAGGLTNIALKTGLTATTAFSTRTLKGVDYAAVALKSDRAVAGECTITIVNTTKGLLTTQKLPVLKNVVVKNVTFTFENGVYEDQKNEIGYEIVDTEGNTVTDYATLQDVYNADNSALTLVREKDGTGKFIWNLEGQKFVTHTSTSDRSSTPQTFVTCWNKTTGGDYLVKTTQCTVYEKRYAKTVSGIAKDAVVSFPKSGTFEIDAKKILLADQYSNEIKNGDALFTKTISAGSISTTGTAITVATNGCFNYYVDNTNMKLIVTPSSVGSGTVYMAFCSGSAEQDVRDDHDGNDDITVTSTKYDAKFAINIYDTSDLDVSDIKISKINDGYDVTTQAAFDASMKVVVTAMIGGAETVIPESQYTIIGNDNKSFSEAEDKAGTKTKTATLKIQVTTWDKSGAPVDTIVTKDYTVSKADPKVFKVDDKVGDDVLNNIARNTTVLTPSALITRFVYKTQYGTTVTSGSISGVDAGTIKYSLSLEEGRNDGCKITNNNTNNPYVVFSEKDDYVIKVTAVALDGTEKSVKYTVHVNS